MMHEIDALQRWMCGQHGAAFVESLPETKVGIADEARPGNWPLNGLRHPPQDDTSGWYFWAGEKMGDAPDFFKPLHVSHLPDVLPAVLPYLGLAPGWRFLLAGEYEDVWYDAELLKV